MYCFSSVLFFLKNSLTEWVIYNYRAINCTVISLTYTICWLISNITAIIKASQRWIVSWKALSRSLSSIRCMNSLNIQQQGDGLDLSISTRATGTIFQGSLFHFQSADRIRKFSYRPFLNHWRFSTVFPFSLLHTTHFSFNGQVPISGQVDLPSLDSSCLFLCILISFSAKSGHFFYRVDPKHVPFTSTSNPY